MLGAYGGHAGSDATRQLTVYFFLSHRGFGKIFGKAACLRCFGKATIRKKNENLHALNHCLIK
jgi:hypothetical protein